MLLDYNPVDLCPKMRDIIRNGQIAGGFTARRVDTLVPIEVTPSIVEPGTVTRLRFGFMNVKRITRFA